MSPPTATGWPFRRIAIVNRGEPAVRLIRAVREMDQTEGRRLTTIALFSDPDERALFVREADEAVSIGPAMFADRATGRRESVYLDHERLERALRRARAEAVWVGWGFVAEQPRFAELCERLGIVFIGPSAAAMRALGDKIGAKRLAAELGLPLAPWSGGPVGRRDEALAVAERIGFPLMVKSAAGGGGRGVRRVEEPGQLGPAVEAARAEAAAAFGDPTVFLERLVTRARHVEVQIARDAHGGAWALGVRDCSIQRRHQKVIEESSSTALDARTEARLSEHAVRLCASVDYRGLATVEFLLDPHDGSLSFMEVNARLQVEHPVTEATTGVDLVKLQLRLAAGERLEGEAPPGFGHAIEARLCAEDPESGFAPAPGLIELLRLPGGPGIRVDCGIAEGDVIPPEFDSMIAKVIAWGRDRREALSRLTRALRETAVVVREGTTNRAFLLRLASRPEVQAGDLDVTWLERSGAESAPLDRRLAGVALLQAAVEAAEEDLRREKVHFYTTAARGRPEAARAVGRPVELSHGDQVYRLTVSTLAPSRYRVAGEGGCAELRVERMGRFERRLVLSGRRHHVLVVLQGPTYLVEVDGVPFRLRSGDVGMVRAPAPGVVSAVLVELGDRVATGAPVAVLEAMKMESTIFAPVSGTVVRLMTGANRQVAPGTPLLQIEPAGEEARTGVARISLDDPRCDGDEPGDRYLDDLALLRRLVLGFDADTADVNRAVATHARLSADGLTPEVLALEDEVLGAFADISSLSRPRPGEAEEWGEQAHSAHDQFFDYLRAIETRGRDLQEGFRANLIRALAHYGVRGLERTPELEDALFRVFKAHQRVEQQLPAIMAILDRRVEQAGSDPAAGDALRALLQRLLVATEHRFPAVSDLAREAQYRYFHRPEFERGRQRVYAEMETHLAYLADHPDGPDRAERFRLLVDCPQPMQAFLLALAQDAAPDRRRLMLEVLIGRYYRLRSPEELGTFQADGRTWGTARFFEKGRAQRVLSTFGAYDDLDALLRDAAATLDGLGHEEEAVLDLQVWRPGPPADADVLEPAVGRAVTAADLPARVVRVLVSVSDPGRAGRRSRSNHLTYWRAEAGFAEDRTCRGLHPLMAERLELWRLDNFRIQRLPSTEDVYLFHAVAKENPADERLFAIAEVRDVTPVRDASGRVIGLPHMERMFLEALAAIRYVQAQRPPEQRLQWNRVTLHVWPPLDIQPDEMHGIVNRLTPATDGLGMQKTVVRARMPDPRTGALSDSVMHLSNSLGTGTVIMRFDSPADHPIEPLSAYRQKVVLMRRRGLVYPYDIVSLLTPDEAGGALPPGSFEEQDLAADGRLVAVDRPYGQNSANLVAGVIRSTTWKHPEGMARVILLGDPSRDLGALAEPECRRIIAAIDLAERMGVPLEWFTLSSGARISMDSGTENMDWIAAVLRRLVEFTQAGGEVNLVVNGINVGAQPYWNAEATMLMHTRGILVMTPEGAMVLTGKQALDYSGGVSAEDNLGIGGYERIMGPNGQSQYWAPDLVAACQLLMRHYEHTYRTPGERFPRRAASADPPDRDVRAHPHQAHLGGLERVGDIFSVEANPDRKQAFDIRTVMGAVVDQDLAPLERWLGMRGAETAVVWDAHLGGNPVCLIGIESRPLPRHGPVPSDGPEQWTAGTLFPLSSKKVARALNAASDNRPAVVLANLSGFDGSPESMRELQLEFGAEIGRAVVNFRGPIVFCVISRYHGGAFVVFSNRLNEGLEIAAVEGSYASVIGGAPAAAVVFAREVRRRARADERVRDLEGRLAAAGPAEKTMLRAELAALNERVRSEKLGEVAAEFDAVHTVRRALAMGSIHRIVPAGGLRAYLVDAVERGMRRELAAATEAATGS